MYITLSPSHFFSFYFLVSSAVKAHQFFSEESWDTFKQIFNNYMFEASKVLLSVNYFLFGWKLEKACFCKGESLSPFFNNPIRCSIKFL